MRGKRLLGGGGEYQRDKIMRNDIIKKKEQFNVKILLDYN